MADKNLQAVLEEALVKERNTPAVLAIFNVICNLDPSLRQFFLTGLNAAVEKCSVRLTPNIRSANDTDHLRTLCVQNDQVEGMVNMLMRSIQLLRANNTNAACEYVRLVAACVMIVTLQGFHPEKNCHIFASCGDMLNICLAHPAFDSEARTKFVALLHTLLTLTDKDIGGGDLGSNRHDSSICSDMALSWKQGRSTSTHPRNNSNLDSNNITDSLPRTQQEAPEGTNSTKIASDPWTNTLEKQTPWPTLIEPSVPDNSEKERFSGTSSDSSSIMQQQQQRKKKRDLRPQREAPLAPSLDGVVREQTYARTVSATNSTENIGSYHSTGFSTSTNVTDATDSFCVQEKFDENELERIRMWLKSLRLHKYHSVFLDLNYEAMINITDAELERRGMSARGARTKMLKSIGNLRQSEQTQLADLDDIFAEINSGRYEKALFALHDMALAPRPPRTQQLTTFSAKFKHILGTCANMFLSDIIRLRRQELDLLVRCLNLARSHKMLSHEEKAEMEFYLNRIEAKTSKSDIRTSDEGHASRKIGLGNMIQGTSEADVIGSGSAPSASQSGSANTSVANANIPNRAKRRQIADTRRGLRISNLRGKKGTGRPRHEPTDSTSPGAGFATNRRAISTEMLSYTQHTSNDYSHSLPTSVHAPNFETLRAIAADYQSYEPQQSKQLLKHNLQDAHHHSLYHGFHQLESNGSEFWDPGDNFPYDGSTESRSSTVRSHYGSQELVEPRPARHSFPLIQPFEQILTLEQKPDVQAQLQPLSAQPQSSPQQPQTPSQHMLMQLPPQHTSFIDGDAIVVMPMTQASMVPSQRHQLYRTPSHHLSSHSSNHQHIQLTQSQGVHQDAQYFEDDDDELFSNICYDVAETSMRDA